MTSCVWRLIVGASRHYDIPVKIATASRASFGDVRCDRNTGPPHLRSQSIQLFFGKGLCETVSQLCEVHGTLPDHQVLIRFRHPRMMPKAKEPFNYSTIQPFNPPCESRAAFLIQLFNYSITPHSYRMFPSGYSSWFSSSRDSSICVGNQLHLQGQSQLKEYLFPWVSHGAISLRA